MQTQTNTHRDDDLDTCYAVLERFMADLLKMSDKINVIIEAKN